MVNNKSHKKSKSIKCRFCGVSRCRSVMTKIPKKAQKLSKWIEILGPTFAENIKKFKTNFICLDHIEKGNSSAKRIPKRPETVLPVIEDNVEENNVEVTKKQNQEMEVEEEEDRDIVVMVPMKDEVMPFDSRPIYRNIIMKTEEPAGNCEEVLPNETGSTDDQRFTMEEDTPSVSAEEFEMEEEEEEENRDTVEMVPMKHEDLPFGNRTDQGNTTMNNVIITCRACGVQKDEKMMTAVPKNPLYLHKWIELLGMEFLKNISHNPLPHFVCWIHTRTMLAKLCNEKEEDEEEDEVITL